MIELEFWVMFWSLLILFNIHIKDEDNKSIAEMELIAAIVSFIAILFIKFRG